MTNLLIRNSAGTASSDTLRPIGRPISIKFLWARSRLRDNSPSEKSRPIGRIVGERTGHWVPTFRVEEANPRRVVLKQSTIPKQMYAYSAAESDIRWTSCTNCCSRSVYWVSRSSSAAGKLPWRTSAIRAKIWALQIPLIKYKLFERDLHNILHLIYSLYQWAMIIEKRRLHCSGPIITYLQTLWHAIWNRFRIYGRTKKKLPAKFINSCTSILFKTVRGTGGGVGAGVPPVGI